VPQPNGNRGPGAVPRGVFPCLPASSGEEAWCAIEVTDDRQWQGLVAALGAPQWMREDKLAALGRRVGSDKFGGKLAFLRGYSGVLRSGDTVMNATKDTKQRISRILQMHANHREERDQIMAGEIAAIVGFKNTTTGDTLAVDTAPIRLESMDFPEPVIAVAIEPKTKGDQDKLSQGLQRLAEEDPTFRVRTDDETGQTLISGMGELHLEIIVDRLLREFKVDANVGKPQVAYRETISKPVEKIEGCLVRQTGGRGQFWHALINPSPVSYTHMTLPTIYSVSISVASLSLQQHTSIF